MGEEKTFNINDTQRAIEAVMEDLKKWESPNCDPRIKAIILTKLEEAWLFGLKLVK